jgi:glutathione S-transferase
MDAQINLFSLKRGGMDIDAGNSYIDRQKERIPLILAYLGPWVQTLDKSNPTHWNFVSMSLYSYLDWGVFRNLLHLKNDSIFIKFLEDFKNSPGVLETKPF